MASAERRRAECTLESLGNAGCDEQQRKSQRRPRRCHYLMPKWVRHRPSFDRHLWWREPSVVGRRSWMWGDRREKALFTHLPVRRSLLITRASKLRRAEGALRALRGSQSQKAAGIPCCFSVVSGTVVSSSGSWGHSQRPAPVSWGQLEPPLSNVRTAHHHAFNRLRQVGKDREGDPGR